MNHVGKNVKLGDNVRMWHFTYIGDGAEIGDNTKIGSLVHIDYGVKIGSDCKIEGSAYIPPLTVIGDGVVGMGSVVTRDVSPDVVVYGNPARVMYSLEEYLEKKREWERDYHS
jgi:acetyltransferase-like isoleucine patch superfamily enzyme